MKLPLLSGFRVCSAKGEIAHPHHIGNSVKIPEELDLLAAVRRLVGPEIFRMRKLRKIQSGDLSVSGLLGFVAYFIVSNNQKKKRRKKRRR